MQLSLNVQLPLENGGLVGEAVYIDTEGSFVVSRLMEMAQSLLIYAQMSDFLSKIHLFRIHSHQELLALVETLNDFLKDHPKVKLIVIDSVAFHFRQNMTDMAQRTRLLNTMASTLRKLAHEHQLVIVLTNQMTTKVLHSSATNATTESSSVLVPALGESWGHACTSRIILFWQNSVRKAWLAKSPNQSEKIISFEITSKGIQDVSRKRMHSDEPE